MIQDQSIESCQGTENSKTVSYRINRFEKRSYVHHFHSRVCEHLTSVIAKNRHWICPSLTPWICSRNTRHIIQPAIHNFSLVVHPCDLICSKIFVSRVSIWLHPCKNFLHLCIRRADPFQTAWLSVSHLCACRVFIPKERFSVRGHIYLLWSCYPTQVIHPKHIFYDSQGTKIYRHYNNYCAKVQISNLSLLF